jgi:signal transduction histidine kinase
LENNRLTIRNQILVPFAATVILAVATIAVSAAWFSAQRSERTTLRQLSNIVGTLSNSTLTYTQPILEKMQGLSGAEFVAISPAKQVVTSTVPVTRDMLDEARNAPLITAGRSFSEFPSIEYGETRYFTARLRADGAANVGTLLVLYPEASYREARWQAAWPPLVIGGVTMLIVFAISVWLAHRISSRVQSVQHLLAEIANGRFPHSGVTDDSKNSASTNELDALIQSAGELSVQLQSLQDTIRHTERVRTLAQLAGGLAHQLRNCVTGARMAIQLHNRRCSTSDDDETLEVALRQLTLTEQHIKGLLSLTRKEDGPADSGSLSDLINDLERLMRPHAEHAHVTFEVVATIPDLITVSDAEQFRTASLNLALNAIEAAGNEGDVRVEATVASNQITIRITDSGDGPPAEISETCFDPFVTSKPEGVGLGLALAKRFADENHGTLEWQRHNSRTVFSLTIPTSDK